MCLAWGERQQRWVCEWVGEATLKNTMLTIMRENEELQHFQELVKLLIGVFNERNTK